MLSIATVFGRSAAGEMGSLGGYREVLKRVLMSVDFPSPDSPVGNCGVRDTSHFVHGQIGTDRPPWR